MKHAIVLYVVALSAPAWGQTIDVAGHWENADKDRRVEFTDCGDGTPCGHIRWVANGRTEEPRDRFNPDPTLRARPLVGTMVLWGFQRSGVTWQGGRVYDTSCGDTLSARMSLQDPNTIKLRACIFSLICSTQRWHRIVPSQHIIDGDGQS